MTAQEKVSPTDVDVQKTEKHQQRFDQIPMIDHPEHQRDDWDREQALLKEMIDKEAQLEALEKEQRDYQKQIKHIQNSRTWKMTRPFVWLTDLFLKLIGRKKIAQQEYYIMQLEQSIATLKKELYDTRNKLRDRLLSYQGTSNIDLLEEIRSLKLEGNLIDFLDKMLLDKQTFEHQYKTALHFTARLFMKEDKEKRDFVYEKIFSALKVDEVPEFMIRAGLEENGMPLQYVSSFRINLHMRMRQKQLANELPEFLLEDKIEAYRFVDMLNIKKPRIIGQNYTFANIPRQTGVAIKPVDGAGSRGVYLVHDLDHIIDVHQKQKLTNWDALSKNVEKYLQQGLVKEDSWLVEELIFEDPDHRIPASDLKFYSFYGRVGMILEIVRYPDIKYCWWTASGERIRTGKYDNHLFHGEGVTPEEIEIISQISEEIPAPFIRIDFLRSNEGLVFGEFTAKPGNYDEFNDVTDRMLGDYYIEAQDRLMNDLMNGKRFELFERYKKEFENFVHK